MKKSKGGNIVSQGHLLVEAKQITPLTTQEQKIVLTIISMLQPTDTDYPTLKLSVTEFLELIEHKSKTNHKYIVEVCTKLKNKNIIINRGNGKTLTTSWILEAEYDSKQGMIEFTLSKKLMPYLLQLKKGFYSSYPLATAIKLNSSYSIRIFEIANKWSHSKQGVRFPIDDFREMVGATQTAYVNFGNFKQKVLAPALTEINSDKTDLKVEFTEIKTGRKVTGIELTIKKKPKAKKTPGSKKKSIE